MDPEIGLLHSVNRIYFSNTVQAKGPSLLFYLTVRLLNSLWGKNFWHIRILIASLCYITGLGAKNSIAELEST